MPALKIRADAFDAMETWQEIQEDFAVPVVLGEPARVTDEHGVEWVVFDDPRITEEQILVVALEVSGE